MLVIALMNLLLAAPIECPAGTTLEHETSTYSEWFSCEREGLREGPFAFVTNGKVAALSQYKGGLLDGESRSIHADGGVSTIKRYRSDALHGLQEQLFENGTRMYEQYFVGGEAHGTLRRYRADGSLIVVSQWARGKPQSYAAYFPNGRPRFTADTPLPNTTVNEWSETGKLLRSVKLVTGVEAARADRSDEGSLSCPKEGFAGVKALDVSYTEDECSGFPRLNEKTSRMETYAFVPRKSREAVAKLGCTFVVTRTAEEFEQMSWESYFHSKAEVGE